MEIYFNELSIENTDSLDYETIEKMAGVYRVLKENEINTCRIDGKDNSRLFKMVDGLPNANTIKNFYFSFLNRRMNRMRLKRIRMSIINILGDIRKRIVLDWR